MSKKTYDQYPVYYIKFKDHFYNNEEDGISISEIKKQKSMFIEVVGFLVHENEHYYVIVSVVNTGPGKNGRETFRNRYPFWILKNTVTEMKKFIVDE